MQHKTRISTAFKVQFKQAKFYKSYCAETTVPYALDVKCEDDCNDASIAFFEFSGYNTVLGTCPNYTNDFCTIDVFSILNEKCRGKSECKTEVNDKIFGKRDQCFGNQLKTVFTCECSFVAPEANKKIKFIMSDGKKTFIETQKKVYSDSEKMYFMLDKDANLQVYDTEGNIKFANGAKKSEGQEPFILSLTTKGDIQIKDVKEKVLWKSDTEGKGKSPTKLKLSDAGQIELRDNEDQVIWRSKMPEDKKASTQ